MADDADIIPGPYILQYGYHFGVVIIKLIFGPSFFFCPCGFRQTNVAACGQCGTLSGYYFFLNGRGCFADLYSSLIQGDGGGWIYTAVRNTCLNRMKHLQVERDNAKALYEATLADVKSNYREHEALLQKAETIARSLPEPTCTILRLCYYEHLTYREVAQQLGISPDTVKKHISKALRTLREAMKE